MDNVTEIYVAVDDFMQQFLPQFEQNLLTAQIKKRRRQARLSSGEIITILILFHQSDYRTLKHFYLLEICGKYRKVFRSISYSGFNRLQQQVMIPFCVYLESQKGSVTGISYVDSTPVKVCHNKRIARHCVFSEEAGRSKTTMGWFYGFKLHLIVNGRGELLSFHVSKGNCDDRQPLLNLVKNIFGKLFGDKGYLGENWRTLLEPKGIDLITTVRKNMKQRILSEFDKVLLRKRFIIEMINDQLKNISQVEHTRHRSIKSFIVNLIAGLSAYCHKEKKPSLDLQYIRTGNQMICVLVKA